MTTSNVKRIGAAWPFLILAVAGGAAAYFQMFSGFAPYDDEGYMLVALQSFVDGQTLYSDVYTQYGPFYYELFGLLFALTGRPVTTDAGRLIVLAEWIAISLLMAGSVWALVRSRLLALVTMAVALRTLPLLVAEPMHPVGLVVVLLSGVLACVAASDRMSPRTSGLLLGSCCAALLLTKINIGAFAVLALLVALAFAHQGTVGARRWVWAAAGLLAIVPLALMSGDLSEPWVRRMLLLVWAGLACIAIAVMRMRTATDAEQRELWSSRWLTAFVVSTAGVSIVIVVIALVLGSSVSDLVAGVLLDPTRLRDIFTIPLPLPEAALDWSLAAIAVVIVWSLAPGAGKPHVVSGAGRIVAGLVVWFSVTASSPVMLQPGSGRLALPVLLVWLVAIPPSSGRLSTRERFARLALVLVPVLGVLQAYPVAGTQAWAAALMFVPAGALLLHDGAQELRSVLGSRSPDHQRWLAVAGVVGAAVLLVKFVVPTLDSIQSGARAYADSPSLAVNGGQRVHLDPARAEGLRELVGAIREECDTFVSRPGLNSLYIWSGMAPPTGLNAGDWMFLLDAEQQQRIVDAIRGVRRLCLVQNDELAQNWIAASGDAAAPDRPLQRYLDQAGFEPVMSVLDGRYQLLRR